MIGVAAISTEAAVPVARLCAKASIQGRRLVFANPDLTNVKAGEDVADTISDTFTTCVILMGVLIRRRT